MEEAVCPVEGTLLDAQAGGEELLENPLKKTSLLLWAGSAWFRCCSHQVSSVVLQKVLGWEEYGFSFPSGGGCTGGERWLGWATWAAPRLAEQIFPGLYIH